MSATEIPASEYAGVQSVESSDGEAQTASRGRISAVRAVGAAAVLVGAGAGLAFASRHGRPTAVPRAARSFVELAEVGMPPASDLRPLEALHDGNVCDTTEELFGGLCYKKCELLTEGSAPIRTTPWSCCESKPCSLDKEHVKPPIPCRGFDVSGAGTCPHKPGACLLDEELFLGRCYKKCSVLTNGEYTHRVGEATCCKTTGLGCLNFRNDKTDAGFDIGGGAGDHDASTPSSVHYPLPSLTEQRTPVDAAQQEQHLHLSEAMLRPLENRHDGNVCDDEEELHDGLCYRKCDLLTHGEAPIRTSPWTCCESHPCGLRNQRGEVGTSIMCNGFDISADGRCPHKPGACLTDEEMFLDMCFLKCSLLTKGEFPHRVGPASCCKSESSLACLVPSNDKSSIGFARGGGEGKEAQVHFPEESLTESEHKGVTAMLKRRLRAQ